jgi:probable HAF family extracellular repeat protein
MISIRCLNLSALLLVFQFSSAALGVGPYYVTNLGDLPGGADANFADGINDYGQVVGRSTTALGDHAYLWTPTTANGISGTLVDLDPLSTRLSHSNAFEINSYGQVAGYSLGSNKAFLWTPDSPNGSIGSKVDLGSNGSRATAINSSGQVVGHAGSGDTFLWSPIAPNGNTGSMINLSADSQIVRPDINDFGQVVGAPLVNAIRNDPYIWTPSTPNSSTGTFTLWRNLPGATSSTYGQAINSYGQVTGWKSVSGNDQAFLWTPTSANGTSGTMIDLGVLAVSDESLGVEINASGQVIGGSGGHAFIWRPTTPNGTTGSMFDLNLLMDSVSGAGWTLQSPESINAAGQIAGIGFYDPDGPGSEPAVTRGFLLTPMTVPEPDTTVILAISYFWLCFERCRSWRRKEPRGW